MSVTILFGVLFFGCGIFKVQSQDDCKPVNCKKGHWGNWLECSTTCGDSGVQTRKRPIFREATCGGKCDGTTEDQACNRKCCPQDCSYMEWSEWGKCYCAETCEEGGNRNICHRSRVKNVTEACGGFCDDKTSEEKCMELCCSQDCVTGEWQEWGECNAQCEQEGAKNRTQSVEQEAKCGGKACEPHYQYQSCDGDCCPVDCVLGDWSEWSRCAGECKKSHHFQHRHVSFSECGGVNCTVFNKYQKKKCDPSEYNVDCQVNPHYFLKFQLLKNDESQE